MFEIKELQNKVITCSSQATHNKRPFRNFRVEPTRPDDFQKSGPLSYRSKKSPTAKDFTYLHKNEDNDVNDNVIIDLTHENRTNDLHIQNNIRNSDVVSISVISSGTVTVKQRQLEQTNGEQNISKNDSKWLSWIEEQLQKITVEDGHIRLSELKEAFGVKKSFFTERFLELFDHDGNGSVKHKEFIDGLRFLINADLAQKLKFLFNVYDIDGNGILDRKELKLMLISCMEESSLDFSKDTLDAMTDILFKSGDDDNGEEVTFEKFKTELEKHAGVLENLTLNTNQMFKPPTFVKKKIEISRYCSKNYIKHNLRKVLFLVCYFLMNIGLGVYAAWNYKNSNGFIIVTRISGMNLNFNCMFVCVLMLRKCLTKLRETFVTKILPLDQCILFHKMVGFMIAFWSVVHTLAHIGNAIKWDSDDENLHLWEILFTTKSGIGWVGYSAILTGWALDIIVIIMIVCSLSFIREGGHFQVFYITHMLYIPFWILCIIHASNFWKWFIAPGVLFLGEKLLRSKIMVLARYGKTYIKEVSLFSSGVCQLVISRPENFQYRPGDYIFLQIPAIAKHQWHPFSISSAPEMKGCIWLHVRSAGNWTKRLYEYFQKYNCLIEVKQYEQKEKKSNSINITKKESKEEISETDRNQMRLFDRVIGYTETSKKGQSSVLY